MNGQTTAWNRLLKDQELFGLHIQLLSSLPVKIREECYFDSSAGIEGTVYVPEQGNSVDRVTVVSVPKLLRWGFDLISLLCTDPNFDATAAAGRFFGAVAGATIKSYTHLV